MKFESKPAEIEAVLWDGRSHSGPFMVLAWTEPKLPGEPDGELWVEKSNAWCDIRLGDYIVQEPDGAGYYPCAGNIFEARWAPVG